MQRAFWRSLLIILLALALLPLGGARAAAPSLSAEADIPAAMSAAETETAALEASLKEEIIYAALSPAGQVESISVVNRFLLEQPGIIQDYGRYGAVRNLSNDATAEIIGDSLRFSAPAGAFYYQGELIDTPLPWDVAVRYYLDGAEKSAAEIAGQSGLLGISIDISQNPLAEPLFFENYALQITVTLDSDKCRDIQAPEATVAGAGSAKTLSYIVFSNKGAQLTLSARVTDFAMPGITFAGIPLNFSLEDIDSSRFDDLQKLTDGIVELDDAILDLHDGVIELDDAAREFRDGLGELCDGAGELYDGAGELSQGAGDLYDGAAQLTDGIDQYAGGVAELKYGLSEFSGGFSEFSGGLAEYHSQIKNYALSFRQALTGYAPLFAGAGELALGSAEFLANLEQAGAGAEYYQGLVDNAEDALGTLMYNLNIALMSKDNEQAMLLLAEYPDVIEDLAEASAGLGAASAMQGLAAGYAELHAGILGLEQGLNSIDPAAPGLGPGLTQLLAGAEALAEGAGGLAAGAAELGQGADGIYDGARQLAKAGAELTDGAVELTDGLHEYWQDGAIELRRGMGEIWDGAAELKDGADKLKDGTAELSDGVSEMKDGVGEMRDETGDMDAQLEKEIEKLLEEYGGRDFDPISFVSAQNRVESVQFVLKTADIEAPETPEKKAPLEEAGSVWQRIVALARHWQQFTDAIRSWFA